MSKVYNKPPMLQLMRQLYDIEEPASVLAFLDANAFLVPLLLDVRDVVQRYFPGTPIVLKVVTDPEAIGRRELVAAIAPRTPPADAVARLMQFLDDWWLDAQDRASDKLTVTIEYQ